MYDSLIHSHFTSHSFTQAETNHWDSSHSWTGDLEQDRCANVSHITANMTLTIHEEWTHTNLNIILQNISSQLIQYFPKLITDQYNTVKHDSAPALEICWISCRSSLLLKPQGAQRSKVNTLTDDDTRCRRSASGCYGAQSAAIAACNVFTLHHTDLGAVSCLTAFTLSEST